MSEITQADLYAVWPENSPDKVRYARTRLGAAWIMFWVGLTTMQRMVCLYPQEGNGND